MAKCLSTLTDLKVLCIEFHSPQSRPDNEPKRTLPLKRETLHSLTHFNFRGASDYLEDLLARIDAPVLIHVEITLFNQLIFRVPQLSRFIGSMETLKSAKVAEMESSFGSGVSIKLEQPRGADASAKPDTVGCGRPLSLCVLCGVLDWQISSIAQICNQSPLLSSVERLEIRADYLRLGYRCQDDQSMDSVPWSELFRSFTLVQMLCISGELGPHVALALEKEVAMRMVVAEVLLPRLRVLRFECSSKSAPVDKFVDACQTFGRSTIEVQHVSFQPREKWDDVSEARNKEP
jgi:hypothetical protein